MFLGVDRSAPAALFAIAAGLLLAVIPTGCGSPSPPPPTALPAAAAPQTALPQAGVPEGETWDAILMQGAPLGFVHTTTRHVQQEGRLLLEVRAEQQMTVQRFGNQTTPGASFQSVETPEGQLIRFQSQQQVGPTPQSARGEVRDGQLIIETTTTGKTEASRLAWSDRYGGLFALEHALLRSPLKPGEQRTVQALAPIFNQLATYKFTARSEEETRLLEGTRKLLKIDVETSFAGGQTINSVAWTDSRGEILKTKTDAFSWETYRTTKERALGAGAGGGAAPDLGVAAIVRLEHPLVLPHQARRMRYKVTIEGSSGGPENDPARVFPSGPHQQVRSLGANRAEIIVMAEDPRGPQLAPQPPPLDADRQPNNLIQSDHELIVRMAREAAAGETNPRAVALALERYVQANVKTKNFTQALATAADVAQTREGDCTEHAVLLAALARANGIPARVAIGLVYVESLQGFGYHMWNELYLEDGWKPFDATLGQGGIGAGHLKLAHSSLAGGDALTAFLPVAQVLGRLKIQSVSPVGGEG